MTEPETSDKVDQPPEVSGTSPRAQARDATDDLVTSDKADQLARTDQLREKLKKDLVKLRAKNVRLKAYQDACQGNYPNIWYHPDKGECFESPPQQVPEGWEPGMEIE